MKDLVFHYIYAQIITLLSALVLVGCGMSNPVAGSPTSTNDSVPSVAVQVNTVQNDNAPSNSIEQASPVTLKADNDLLGLSLPNWLDDAILWSLLLLCVVAVIIFWVESDKLYDRVSRHRSEIDRLKNKEKEFDSRIGEFSSRIRELQSRIETLERKHSIQKSAALSQKTQEANETRLRNEYYASAPLQGQGYVFFDCLYDHQDVHSMFKIELQGDSGTYEILDLQRVRSSDQAQLVVSFDTSKCSWDSATTFNQSVGHIMKNGDIWVVDLNHKCSVILS